MASTFANALRQMAEDELPRCPQNSPCRGSSGSLQVQKHLQEAWNAMDCVWENLRASRQHMDQQKALEMTDTAFSRVKEAELQNYKHELAGYWNQHDGRIRKGCTNTSDPWE